MRALLELEQRLRAEVPGILLTFDTSCLLASPGFEMSTLSNKKKTEKISTADIRLWKAERNRYKLTCCYCSGPIGRGNLDIEGIAAHATCHKLACA